MTTFRGLPALLAACLALGACAATPPATPETARIDSAPVVFYTAGAGDVMLVSDRCAAEICTAADGSPLPGMTELIYLGMRSPTEAVFVSRQVAIHTGPLKQTDIPGLMVPDRPGVETAEAPFIGRTGGSFGDSATEIVVNPVAGVAFGVEDLVVEITSVAPGRVVYLLEKV